MIEQAIKEIVAETIHLEFSRFEERMEKSNSFPEIMTLPQICQYLSISAPSVRKAIKDNNLPVTKVFGEKAPRFVKKQIDNWLMEVK